MAAVVMAEVVAFCCHRPGTPGIRQHQALGAVASAAAMSLLCAACCYVLRTRLPLAMYTDIGSYVLRHHLVTDWARSSKKREHQCGGGTLTPSSVASEY